MVWYAPSVTFEQMQSGAAAGAAQLGMSLAGPPVVADMKGGRALVTEVVGTAPDGSKLRGRLPAGAAVPRPRDAQAAAQGA